jgi:hypothetical protein
MGRDQYGKKDKAEGIKSKAKSENKYNQQSIVWRSGFSSPYGHVLKKCCVSNRKGGNIGINILLRLMV